MDSEDRFIPIVEDDQGEGYKDLVEEYTKGLKETLSIGDNVLEHLIPNPSLQVRSPSELDLAAKMISETKENS